MKYVEIKTIDPDTGNILFGIDEDTGRAYDFRLLAVTKGFSHIVPATLAGYTAPNKPGGQVVRINVCEISGVGHFFDIAGNGAQGEEGKYIFGKMTPPEFWYMTLETARRYGCI